MKPLSDVTIQQIIDAPIEQAGHQVIYDANEMRFRELMEFHDQLCLKSLWFIEGKSLNVEPDRTRATEYEIECFRRFGKLGEIVKDIAMLRYPVATKLWFDE